MRLQLISISIIAAFTVSGQNDDNYLMKENEREVEANFLTNYYQQEGNNAAVTGGVGTEHLTNFANVFIVNVPIDSIQSIGLYAGADYYSSASTDRIDPIMSSASSSDLRGFGTISYNRKNLKRHETYGLRLGASAEYDYLSFSLGGSFTKEWDRGNRELSIVGQAFFDQWKLIYPWELRGQVELPRSDRQSYNGQILYSQVINKRLQMSVSAEFVLMKGLLSTPFHRVYFADQLSPDVERLPESRLKVPASIRLNYFPTDFLIFRSFYRYYWDDFGIVGHSAELEVPVKLSAKWTVAPFYRYHQQSGAKYFAPYRIHESTETFYSSDFDLAELSSNKAGLGLRYSPVEGLTRSKPFFPQERVFLWKYVEMRGGYYYRDTGLNAYFITVNFGFSLL